MEPYFETENGQLYHGNCLDILSCLSNNGVDAVITDPPYGTNDTKGKNIKRGKKDTSFNVLEWDKQLPLDYIDALYYKMKDDCWGFIFTDNMAVTTLWNKIEYAQLSPRNTFYWHKINKAPTPRCNFKSCVETGVVFTKGRTNQKWYGGGNQSNIISLPFCSQGLHPTQKPILLLQYLISLFTEENDIILDPFFGSGSTGVACETLNRKWIGIDIEETYCDIAAKRINEITLKPKNTIDEKHITKEKGMFTI